MDVLGDAAAFPFDGVLLFEQFEFPLHSDFGQITSETVYGGDAGECDGGEKPTRLPPVRQQNEGNGRAFFVPDAIAVAGDNPERVPAWMDIVVMDAAAVAGLDPI